jgi:hypothetical protein
MGASVKSKKVQIIITAVIMYMVTSIINWCIYLHLMITKEQDPVIVAITLGLSILWYGYKEILVGGINCMIMLIILIISTSIYCSMYNEENPKSYRLQKLQRSCDMTHMALVVVSILVFMSALLLSGIYLVINKKILNEISILSVTVMITSISMLVTNEIQYRTLRTGKES